MSKYLDDPEFKHRKDLAAFVACLQNFKCPLSGRDVYDGGIFDLHEFFVPKSKCPKPKQDKINVPINCILIERSYHSGAAVSPIERDRLCYLHKISIGYTNDDFRMFIDRVGLRTFGKLEGWLYRHNIP